MASVVVLLRHSHCRERSLAQNCIRTCTKTIIGTTCIGIVSMSITPFNKIARPLRCGAGWTTTAKSLFTSKGGSTTRCLVAFPWVSTMVLGIRTGVKRWFRAFKCSFLELIACDLQLSTIADHIRKLSNRIKTGSRFWVT